MSNERTDEAAPRPRVRSANTVATLSVDLNATPLGRLLLRFEEERSELYQPLLDTLQHNYLNDPAKKRMAIASVFHKVLSDCTWTRYKDIGFPRTTITKIFSNCIQESEKSVSCFIEGLQWLIEQQRVESTRFSPTDFFALPTPEQQKQNLGKIAIRASVAPKSLAPQPPSSLTDLSPAGTKRPFEDPGAMADADAEYVEGNTPDFIPRPPSFYAPRTALENNLVDRVLGARQSGVRAIILVGLPGAGKTMTMQAVAHHPRLRQHFKGRVFSLRHLLLPTTEEPFQGASPFNRVYNYQFELMTQVHAAIGRTGTSRREEEQTKNLALLKRMSADDGIRALAELCRAAPRCLLLLDEIDDLAVLRGIDFLRPDVDTVLAAVSDPSGLPALKEAFGEDKTIEVQMPSLTDDEGLAVLRKCMLSDEEAEMITLAAEAMSAASVENMFALPAEARRLVAVTRGSPYVLGIIGRLLRRFPSADNRLPVWREIAAKIIDPSAAHGVVAPASALALLYQQLSPTEQRLWRALALTAPMEPVLTERLIRTALPPSSLVSMGAAQEDSADAPQVAVGGREDLARLRDQIIGLGAALFELIDGPVDRPRLFVHAEAIRFARKTISDAELEQAVLQLEPDPVDLMRRCGEIGYVRALDILLQGRSPDDLTRALYGASAYGRVGAVRRLLEKGARPCQLVTEQGNMTPMMIAAQMGAEKAIMLLLQRVSRLEIDIEIPRVGITALYVAASVGHPEIVHQLLNQSANPSCALRTTLARLSVFHGAAIAGQVGVLRVLLRVLDPNTLTADDNEFTALHICAYYGHLEAARLLLKEGANVDLRASFRAGRPGFSALHIAIERHHLDMADLLLAHGAGIECQSGLDGLSPLVVACQRGFLAAAELLISRGANVEAATPDGERPLGIAARLGFLPLCKLLVERSADLNVQTGPHRATALYLAALGGHARVVEYLLARGANHTTATIDRAFTPLHAAAMGGKYEVARLLIAAGAEIDARGSMSELPATPLYLALAQKNGAVVRLLVESGADLELALGTPRLSYVAVAKTLSTPQIVAYLEEKMSEMRQATATVAMDTSA